MSWGGRLFKRAVDVWEMTQVELHGRFSAGRLRKLQLFMSKTSFQEAVAICVTLPLPCAIILAAMETIPLAPLSAGTLGNYTFWIRYVVSLVIISPGILSNFRDFLPELKISRSVMLLLSVFIGIGSATTAFTLSLFVGFPVPFTLLVSAPAWLVVALPPMISLYKSRFRQNRKLLMKFIHCWIIVASLAVLVFIYPIYIFGFYQLESTWQMFYVGLLPILKIAARNVISWYIGDCCDVKSVMVIFNVEVFSAMYISVALQNTSKLSITLAVMAVDIVQSKVAISDIDKMLRDIDRITSSVTSQHSSFQHMYFTQGSTIPAESSWRRNLPTSGYVKPSTAHRVGPENFPVSPTPESRRTVRPSIAQILPSPPARPSTVDSKLDGASTQQFPAETDNALAAAGKRTHLQMNRLSKKDHQRFVSKSAQVLFTAEFVLLVRYVEAIIPAIYASFVLISYSLPNRKYFEQFATLTPSNLNNAILNVVIYCLLKMLSFCLMCFILSRKLGVSSIHLVAFVLAHQWEATFSRTMTWVTYTTLTSLKHSGPDYTFQFAWLRKV